MPRRLARKLHKINPETKIRFVYAAILCLFFHTFVVAYINSSFIGQFVTNEGISGIYSLGAALTILIFLFVSRVLQGVGNYRATIGYLFINLLAVTGMAFADSFATAIPLFLIHLTVLPLIFFNLDVYLEELIGKKESTTGSRRGLLLAITSFIGASTPLFTGYLVGEGANFTYAYYASALALLPAIAITIFTFRDIKDPKYKEIKVLKAFRSFWIDKNVRFVFNAHLLLQIFFFFMVAYAPLYLATEIKLSWQQIGIILFGGQLAYTFFEYPIGKISDKLIGEKEMMMVGFLILASTSAILSFIDTNAIWPWIFAMFATRIGASLVEVTTESYFFKHTKGSDAQVISFFRITRPLGYLLGALIGGLSLLFMPFQLVFVVLGLCMLPGVLFASFLHDTR